MVFFCFFFGGGDGVKWAWVEKYAKVRCRNPVFFFFLGKRAFHLPHLMFVCTPITFIEKILRNKMHHFITILYSATASV